MGARHRQDRVPRARRHRRGDRRSIERRPRFRGHGRLRAHRGGTGDASPHLPSARGDAQGDGRVSHGAQGIVLRAVGRHRRHAIRLVGGHRGRHRHLLRLLQPRPSRVSQRDLPRGRAGGGAVEGRQLRGAAHLRAARRRGDSHQRLQLPRVGHAREAGAGAARGCAVHREAGHRHELSHGSGVPRHGGREDLPGRCDSAHLWQRG
jgi:hypothetical protein